MAAVQQSCAHFISRLVAPQSTTRSVAACSTAPRRARPSGAASCMHASPLQCATRNWRSDMCMDGTHATATPSRCEPLACLTGMHNRGKRCVLQSSLQGRYTPSSRAVENSTRLRSSVGDRCRSQYEWSWGGAASPSMRRKRQFLVDVYLSSSGCLCARQFRRLSGRWLSVASAMTHAANASPRVHALSKAPVLNQRLRGMRCGPPTRMLKM